MAKALRGEAEIQLGDHKFTLRLALGELEEIENQLGTGILTIASRFSSGKAGLMDARAVLRAGFAGAKIKKTEEQLTTLLEDAGLFPTLQAAATLLLNVLTDTSGKKDEAAEA